MASFVVETYLSQGNAERFTIDVGQITAAVAALAVVGGHVRHVRSYVVPSDEMGFHVVEAESAEEVERITTLARIDVERIVEAIGVGPGGAGTGALDAER